MSNPSQDITLHMATTHEVHGEWCNQHLLPHRSAAHYWALTPGGTALDMGVRTWCDEDDE